jgi:hypothetical protein
VLDRKGVSRRGFSSKLRSSQYVSESDGVASKKRAAANAPRASLFDAPHLVAATIANPIQPIGGSLITNATTNAPATRITPTETNRRRTLNRSNAFDSLSC